jgi:ribosome modulation factor
MSFKTQLQSATTKVKFFDPNAAFAAGQKAYMAGFERAGCPLQEERQRAVWLRGWEEERNRLTAMFQRWRESDRSTR